MTTVTPEGDSWRWDCAECASYARGSDQESLQYSADQHDLTHTQEQAPSVEYPPQPEIPVEE